MNAKELLQAGQLTEAITAVTSEVKNHPTDTAHRGLLAELLCYTGDLERADKHFDTISQQDPKTAVGVAMIRQLIRAETARQEFYSVGRLPEFLTPPPPALQSHLEASIAVRDGDLAKAAELLALAEEQRPQVSGTCDDQAFDDFRDLDDLTASYFEVLTSTGKYYWIPFENVDSLEFHPPERMRDLLWRRVSMSVRGGPDGEVFLPTLYAGTSTNEDDRVRLGRATLWSETGSPIRGTGLRTWLIGDNDVTIMQPQSITFQSANEVDVES